MSSTQKSSPAAARIPGSQEPNDSARKSNTSIPIKPGSVRDMLRPTAPATDLWWARSSGIDEYGCPRHHLIVEVRCPYCAKTHTHGLGTTTEPTSADGGHRAAHCGPRVSSTMDTSVGYYITGLDQVTAPEYPSTRCRQLRAARQQDGTS